MEVLFQKEQCPFLRQILCREQTQELTQELKLTEDLPDIGRVLGAWGQVLIRGKEWRDGRISVLGGVLCRLLYEPEDGSMVRQVESWIPFQVKWDLPDTPREGKIRVTSLLTGMDGRSISARKLMLRAGISLLAEAWIEEQGQLFMPGALPEDVQLKKTTHPVLLPSEMGEKTLELEEELEIPQSCGTAANLISWHLQPEPVDRKVMGDKVVFRGMALLHTLFRTEEGKLSTYDFEIPFSQYAELEGEYTADCGVWIQPEMTALELELLGENRLQLKAGMTCQYLICRRKELELAVDAYSTCRAAVPKFQEMDIPVILEHTEQTLRAQCDIPGEMGTPLDGVFYPRQCRVRENADEYLLELAGQFQVLSTDNQGMLRSQNLRWQEDRKTESPGRMNAQVRPSGLCQASVGDVRSDLLLQSFTFAPKGMAGVVALELGEVCKPDADRPSLILKKAGSQSLWELAKEMGSTMDAISKANGLTGEPAPGQWLLIPVK